MSLLNRVANLTNRFRKDEKGNLVIIAAVLMPVVAGFVVAAIAYSNANASRTNMKGALDSAVLAGVIVSDVISQQTDRAEKYFYSNISGFTAKASTNFVGTFTSDGSIVTGVATGSTANPFGGVLGLPNSISIKATAKAKKDLAQLCILALNKLDSGSMDMNGTSKLNAPNCGIQNNSTSSSGLTQEGQPQAIAKKINVAGGYTGTGYNNTPIANSAPVSDPYANSLARNFPQYDTCSANDIKKGLDIKSNTTLSPGTYCGGIRIYSQAVVTLLPGIYVMNGGPLEIYGGARVSGNKVMIAFTGDGATLYIYGNATLNITSPTTGPYANVQFFEDPEQYVDPKFGLWFSIGGGKNNDLTDTSKVSFDGIVYVPRQQVWVFGNGGADFNSPSMAVVTEKFWIQGNVTVNITTDNTRNLEVSPKPSIGFSARLIE